MANKAPNKPQDPSDAPPGFTITDSVAPAIKIEDSVAAAPKEPAKAVTTTDLPNGIKIEDF